MLAKGEDFNILYDYELVVVFVEYSAVHDFAQVFFVAFRKEEERFCVAIWGIQQAFTVEVFANALQYCPHGTG
jgi:hypothetical protein